MNFLVNFKGIVKFVILWQARERWDEIEFWPVWIHHRKAKEKDGMKVNFDPFEFIIPRQKRKMGWNWILTRDIEFSTPRPSLMIIITFNWPMIFMIPVSKSLESSIWVCRVLGSGIHIYRPNFNTESICGPQRYPDQINVRS